MNVINPYIIETTKGNFRPHPDTADFIPSIKSIRLYDSIIPLSVPSTGYANPGFEHRMYSETHPTWFIGTYLNNAKLNDSDANVPQPNTTVKLSDNGSNRDLMEVRLLLQNIFGEGAYPGKLWEPLLIRPNSSVSLTVYKVSGAAVNTVPYIEGFEHLGIDPTIAKKLEDRAQNVWPFWLAPSIDPLTLTANQSLVFNSVNGRDTFQGFAIVAAPSKPGGATGDYEFEIYSPYHKQALSNGFVAGTTPGTSSAGIAFGSASFPYFLNTPIIVPPGGVLRWKINDLSGASNTIWIALAGRKIRAENENRAIQVEKETRF